MEMFPSLFLTSLDIHSAFVVLALIKRKDLFILSTMISLFVCHSIFVSPSFQLKSTFTELKGNIGYSNNTQLAAAEMRKSELLAVKQNLDRNMASSYQTKAQLQKQLRSILITQNQEGRNPSELCLRQRSQTAKLEPEENIEGQRKI